MKRLIMICGIATIMLQCVKAQEKNYRDEYIFVTEEFDVGDTIDAKRKAEEQARIENEQILNDNMYRLDIVRHIDSLLSCKKAKDEKSLRILQDAYVHKMKTYYSHTDSYIKHLLYDTSEGKKIRKGDLSDNSTCGYLKDYRIYQKEMYQKLTEHKITYNWKNYLTLHKETRKVKKKNPDYREGYTEIDIEWEWLQEISKNGGLEFVQTSFPVEEKYYKSDKFPDYRFYYQDNHYPYVCEKDGTLLGVAADYKRPDYEDGGKMEAATMLYDYEHNVYNIKSESKGVQRWAYYLINKKLGKNTEPNFEKDAMGMMLGIGVVAHEMETLNRLYAYRQITKSEYNRKMSELNAKTKAKGRKNDAVLKKYPSNEEMKRAEKFVEQLESDYNKSKLFSKVHIERMNGTQFMLVSDDKNLKVLKTYSIDSKGKLNASYATVKKD